MELTTAQKIRLRALRAANEWGVPRDQIRTFAREIEMFIWAADRDHAIWKREQELRTHKAEHGTDLPHRESVGGAFDVIGPQPPMRVSGGAA